MLRQRGSRHLGRSGELGARAAPAVALGGPRATSMTVSRFRPWLSSCDSREDGALRVPLAISTARRAAPTSARSRPEAASAASWLRTARSSPWSPRALATVAPRSASSRSRSAWPSSRQLPQLAKWSMRSRLCRRLAATTGSASASRATIAAFPMRSLQVQPEYRWNCRSCLCHPRHCQPASCRPPMAQRSLPERAVARCSDRRCFTTSRMTTSITTPSSSASSPPAREVG
mmetsp:Transcript_57596/g.123875  ORF Transcript_57596/g.123875 Transcript_57596/m.123875 type:complete len:231 (-) Transcript_57596:1053-1745(-)